MEKHIRRILFLTLIIFIISCEEMLEPINENNLGLEYLEESPGFAEGLLLNAYTDIIGPYSFSEVATDDAVINRLSNGYRRMSTGELTSRYNPASRWSKYESVFYLNNFLSTVDIVEWNRDSLINELIKNRIKGEALGLRALFHFYVLEGHAGLGESGELLGVPYYEEFISPDGDFNVPRLSFTETIDKINKDFDEALNLLPMDYSNNPDDIDEKYAEIDPNIYLKAFGDQNNLRISGRIIKALKARVALFAASPAFLNDPTYYQQAAELAAELINDNGGVGSLDITGSEFYNEDSDAYLSEILWRGSITSTSSYQEVENFPPSLNGKGKINPSQNLVDAFPMANGIPIENDNSWYIAAYPYLSRDPRLKMYILYNGGTFGGNVINTGFGAGIDRIDSIAEKSTRTGYYLKKLLRPDVTINNDGSTVNQLQIKSFLRYTELFLILAESANEIGGPNHQVGGISAYDVILALRNRANIINPEVYLQTIVSQEDMRELIRNERRIELCFEGFRFWDLRRWNENLNGTVNGIYYDGSMYSRIDVEDRIFNVNSVYMPIPNSEILKYSNLEQNQGW
ncbi:MAG: RagB/SusD family nutrient uptake outer membrane protein [Bacteroidales bacterium]|nr:RagB/SusD family nutrient uptake outer membrane protein [Bacteroidales bacterium]